MSKRTHKIELGGPVTTVVRRTVQPGRDADYNQWVLRMLNDILVLPHSLGATVQFPESGHGNVYQLAHTFSDAASLRAWEGSAVHRQLSEEADGFSTSQRQPSSSDLETPCPAPHDESALPPPAK